MKEEKDAFSLLDVETFSRAIKQILLYASSLTTRQQASTSKENNRAAHSQRS